MSFAKNSTDRDMLRLMTTQQLRKAANLGEGVSLTPDERYTQARFAQQMRNFWFTATGAPLRNTNGGAALSTFATTNTYAEALIITDILSHQDYKFDTTNPLDWPGQATNLSRFLLRIVRDSGAAYGEDYFGLDGPVGQEFITKHEKNNAQGIPTITLAGATRLFDTQSKFLGLVPRLLAPYETLRATWVTNVNNDFADLGNNAFSPQLGFRAVKALLADNPYSYFSERLDKEIKRYIAETVPETFFLELTFPFANLQARGANLQLVVETDQQQRPLLVLGACSNLEGAQARLEDRSKSYRFTSLDQQTWATLANLNPLYKDVPLNLWAPNTDMRATNLYNMWPVPHLLEPGATLRVTLSNGLMPNLVQVAQQAAATRNAQDVRITFLCRTV